MATAAVFVDTAALLALINPRDEFHARAVELSAGFARRRAILLTSEWVLAEFLGGASRQQTRTAAAQMVERILESRHARVIPASHAAFGRAFELFRKRADKDWSFVDCSSILICQERAIEEVFTHDHHFGQAGLRVLL